MWSTKRKEHIPLNAISVRPSAGKRSGLHPKILIDDSAVA
jgi:hypothetical protein